MLNRRRFDEAVALHRAGKLDEAAAKYAVLLELNPSDPDLLHLSGIVAGQQGDYTGSLLLLRRAVALVPASPDFHNSLAITCERIGDAAQAAAGYNEQGTRLLDLRRYGEALTAYDHALRLQPGSPHYLSNRGVALIRLNRCAEAAELLAGIDDQGHLANIPVNLGNALMGLGRIEEAIAAYDRALALEPEMVEAHWARGQALLLTGRFAEGWAEYEWRRRWRGFYNPYVSLSPGWTGQDATQLDGPLLVVSEQGLGDAIQFSRYLPILAAQGHRIVFEARDELYRLFTQHFQHEAIEIVSRSQALQNGSEAWQAVRRCKTHIPLLSLPLLHGTDEATIPANIPYLSIPDARGASGRPRIGLVRSGQSLHGNDSTRSIQAAVLSPLLDRPAEFLSLQIAPFGAADVAELGAGFRDFADTAAAIAGLDLVISVDTAVAHLAGAMGREAWLLLPHTPDWRWRLTGDTTPWYPTARLFRQGTANDWHGVVAELGTALDEFIAAFSRNDHG